MWGIIGVTAHNHRLNQMQLVLLLQQLSNVVCFVHLQIMLMSTGIVRIGVSFSSVPAKQSNASRWHEQVSQAVTSCVWCRLQMSGVGGAGCNAKGMHCITFSLQLIAM